MVERRQVLRAGALVAAGAAVGRWSRQPAEPDALAAKDRSFAGTRSAEAVATTTKVIWRVETDEPVVALTFDDGPVPAYTQDYLDMLRDRRVPATFNLVGRNALAHPALVRQEIADRHQVENHSWSHLDLATATTAETDAELTRGADVLESLTGRAPRYFRPPRGNLSGATLNAASRVGEDVLLWSVQLHESRLDVDANVAHVLARVQPGSILLAHDSRHRKIDRRIGLRALPVIIDRLRARGFRFVTVDELVAAGTALPPPAVGPLASG